jgi:hypothetical protein
LKLNLMLKNQKNLRKTQKKLLSKEKSLNKKIKTLKRVPCQPTLGQPPAPRLDDQVALARSQSLRLHQAPAAVHRGGKRGAAAGATTTTPASAGR